MDLDGNSAAQAANEDQGTGAIHGGQMRVSADDQTFGYLNGKLVAGANITLTEGSPGAAETLTIAASGGGGVSDGDKGDISVTASGATWTIDNDVVSDAKLRNSGACSVIGRSANSSGDPADIPSSSNDTVLRRRSDVVGFGSIVNADIDAAAAIAFSKLAATPAAASVTITAGAGLTGGGDLSANRTLDVAAGDSSITVNANDIIVATGGISTAKIADDAVTPAKTSFYVNTYTAIADPDFDITGIPSDVFTGLDIYIRGSSATSAFFDILLNDTDTCDAMYHMFNDGGAFNAGSGSGPGVVSATADNVIHIRIWTKTGLRRRCQIRSDGVYSGVNRTYFLSGEWADTAAAVTQLTLRLAGAVNWTAGTKAEVWGF